MKDRGRGRGRRGEVGVLLIGEFVESGSHFFELTLGGELFPDFGGEFVGGHDRVEVGFAAGGHGSHTEFRFVIESGEFETFAKGAECFFQYFGWDVGYGLSV